jgi:putative endonuclease
MPFIYILECADGAYYVGSTWNLEKRLWEHNNGLGANFTRKRLPVRLVYSEHSDEVSVAFAREKQVQGWSRAKKRALIEGRWADLPGLSRRGGSGSADD